MTDEPTMADLTRRAAELKIEGRSAMHREQLMTAIEQAEAAEAVNAAAAAARDAAAQARADAIAAAAVAGELTATPDDIVGRPPLGDVVEARAARREATMRVIGSPEEEV